MEANHPESDPKVKVSVVIPCYNQGKWLWEAIDSVLAQDFNASEFEIIVVNDGSTDPATNQIVNEIEHEKVRTIITENQGLSAARNLGIQQARGEYILPLDSDDRIRPSYMKKAVEILDAQQDIGIVYCRAELFGEEQGLWDLEPYTFPDILLSPQIFASSFFRKGDWLRTGGYQSDMIYGWEDYDFWLSLIKLGVGVHQIDEVLFDYRKTAGSMAGLDRKSMLYSFRKLYEHHRELYETHIECLFEAVIASKHVREFENIAKRDVFEIYVPDEGGYAERNIRKQHYAPGEWATVEIFIDEIPEAGIHLLRIDPSWKMCLVDIASVRLLNADTRTVLYEAVELSAFESFTLGRATFQVPHEKFFRLFCADGDGHVFLPTLDRAIVQEPVLLEVVMFQHPTLESVGSICQQKYQESCSQTKVVNLESELSAHQVQAKELKSELERQRKHALELEKARAAANSAKEQAQLLVENLRSEIRQEQQKVELFERQLEEARNALQASRQTIEQLQETLDEKTKRKGWFSKG